MPTVTGVAPTSGPAVGGNVIVVTGTNFNTLSAAGTFAQFARVAGGATINTTSVTVISSTQLDVTVPAVPLSGNYAVNVTFNGADYTAAGVIYLVYGARRRAIDRFR